MSESEIAQGLRGMRVAYELGSLDESGLAATWHEQLARWLAEATQAGLPEPNAMVVATADAQARPSSRTVLCKGLDERGVVFYTNYASAKSRDLAATGMASATFPWFGMQRQVHVRGPVAKVDPAETAAYWATRPRGSQLGAWASPQSEPVGSRAELEARLAEADRRFAAVDQIPPPPHWGGWRIEPQVVEFWQGRLNRMHDRLAYVRDYGDWLIRRLAP
ncbi:MAG TPA: pyridoxamine 5'-phosphate oxidase [Streptosporangiaceae bacterium]